MVTHSNTVQLSYKSMFSSLRLIVDQSCVGTPVPCQLNDVGSTPPPPTKRNTVCVWVNCSDEGKGGGGGGVGQIALTDPNITYEAIRAEIGSVH